jgi:hypothetical protein
MLSEGAGERPRLATRYRGVVPTSGAITQPRVRDAPQLQSSGEGSGILIPACIARDKHLRSCSDG